MKEIVQMIRMKMTHLIWYLALLTELINFSSEQPDELKLPKWVKASKKRFNEILSIITKAKNNRLKVNVDGTG